jgi:hypothetical protein
VKELEVKLKEEEATKLAAEEYQKKKPGLKGTVEVTRLKKELKMKTEELYKLQAQAKKVSGVKIMYSFKFYLDRKQRELKLMYLLLRSFSLRN